MTLTGSIILKSRAVQISGLRTDDACKNSPMDRYFINLAYKYVALSIMLAEANYYASHLKLPIDLPIRQQDLTANHVSPPRQMGFAGRIDTQQFSFGFGGALGQETGTLRFVVRLNRFEKIPQRELNQKWAKMKSLINKNEAYTLATNWLAAVSVDVQSLEKGYRPTVKQWS